MPAVSRSQQRFFGMVRAAQKGKKMPASIQRAAKSISAKDAHDFAVTKHKGLPEKVAQAIPAHVLFATKLAYVQPAPSLHSTVKPLGNKSVIPHPPAIGQQKKYPVPPATADANKMVMRAAPSVPNPIVPPTQSAEPMPTQKVAASTCAKAPRYTASAKPGKKVMPLPHARRTKTAREDMLPGGKADDADYSKFPKGEMAKGTSHEMEHTDSKRLATEIAGDHVEEDPKYYDKLEKVEKSGAVRFGAMLAEKQAIGGIGTVIGAGLGAYNAPTGHKVEGIGRGGVQGLGWDIGGGLGSGLGAGLGGIAGGLSAPALTALIAKLTGHDLASEDTMGMMAGAAGAGMLAGGGLGAVGGYLGGGELGRRAARSVIGNPTYQKDEQLASQQLGAP